jgi:hypothetical protein
MMAQQQPQQVDIPGMVNELVNRIRILESKQNLFAEKLLIMNQNMIEEHKNSIAEVRKMALSVKDVNEDMNNLKNIMKHLTDEAAGFAKDEDVKVLEKYINVWNPLNFVSEKEVKEMVQKEIENGRKSNTSE